MKPITEMINPWLVAIIHSLIPAAIYICGCWFIQKSAYRRGYTQGLLDAQEIVDTTLATARAVDRQQPKPYNN